MRLINWLHSLNPFPPSRKVVRPQPEEVSGTVVSRRLAHEFCCLETIACQRAAWGDPGFGKAIEDRIIWRELIDLELQEVDAQFDRPDWAESLRPRPQPDA
jgi:hypothetical protein